MTSRLLSRGPLLLAACLLPSCAGKLTEAQRQSLSTVGISRTEMSATAYKRPDAGSQGARQAGAQAGVVGGALGAMLGVAIGEGIAGAQDASFHRSHGGQVSAIEKTTPTDVNQMVNNELNRTVKSDPFFGPRLNQRSENLITSRVSNYGLTRTGSRDGDILFTAQIATQITLRDAAGKELAGGYYLGTGTSSHTIGEFAGNPKLYRQSYEQAAAGALKGFQTELKKKTAN
ncbi:hypothetical protein [Luteolibacter sp. LG18]|uniref:hypothetical protein n=1 Tax=Luteolibacter sp. LG18 TaxID=2819286 RepID=UPI002B292D0D|nr:hypothetical protein llg_05710 [Luteolibacter sp. LG18]